VDDSTAVEQFGDIPGNRKRSSTERKRLAVRCSTASCLGDIVLCFPRQLNPRTSLKSEKGLLKILYSLIFKDYHLDFFYLCPVRLESAY